MRLSLIVMTTLAVAGCSSKVENAAEPAVPANAVNAADNVASKVASLTEDERQGVFLRAIRDSDISCRDVVKAEQIEPTQGTPTWRAQCEQGDAHLILIKPDGSAQVISRRTP